MEMGFVSKTRDDRVNDGRDDSMETGVCGREERGTTVIRFSVKVAWKWIFGGEERGTAARM